MSTEEKLDLILAKVSALEAKTGQSDRAKPYSVKEAAEVLGWSYSHTLRQIDSRILKTLPGKPYRITATEIDRQLSMAR